MSLMLIHASITLDYQSYIEELYDKIGNLMVRFYLKGEIV